MRLTANTAAALALALVGALTWPSSVAACSALVPTFNQVLNRASAIVVGRVSDAVNVDDHPYPDQFTITVERVVRGQAGATVIVDQPAYLCGDRLPADFRGRVIIALDVPFYRQTLSPYWWERGGHLDGWAEYPAGITTLDEMADRIATLPDTATDEPGEPAGAGGVWLLAIACLTALLFLIRPLRRTRQPT